MPGDQPPDHEVLPDSTPEGLEDLTQIDLPQLGTAIQDLENDIMALRSRYDQVCQDDDRRIVLQSEKAQGLKTEIARINHELSVLEHRLESRLFAWSGLRRYFWQTVRFVGLGVLIGWGLASLAQQQKVHPNVKVGATCGMERSK
jgi:hypothetical protein